MNTQQKYYSLSKARILRPVLRRRGTALFVHWLFQGIPAMDITEMIFKLTTDIFLAAVLALITVRWLSIIPALLFGLFIGHSVNFILNGQVFVVLKHFGDVRHEQHEFDRYLRATKDRIRTEPSIRWAAIYGSMSREELKETSDVDLRLIRHPGFVNGIRSCWFVLRERTRAHLHQFPLDVLLLDSPRLLRRHRSDEIPIVLCDRSNGTSLEDSVPS